MKSSPGATGMIRSAQANVCISVAIRRRDRLKLQIEPRSIPRPPDNGLRSERLFRFRRVEPQCVQANTLVRQVPRRDHAPIDLVTPRASKPNRKVQSLFLFILRKMPSNPKERDASWKGSGIVSHQHERQHDGQFSTCTPARTQ